MAQPDDLEARVAALETQVRALTDQVQHSRTDAAAARVLAGGADRDVDAVRGELRDFRQATTASFNALREDLVDLRTRMDNGFVEVHDKIDTGFAQADRNFTEIRGRLDAAAAGHEQLVGLLTTLIQQGEQPDHE